MRRIKKIKFTLLCDNTNNTVPTTRGSQALNGILRGVKIKTPATVDSSATVGVTVADADGDNVYSKTGIAANTTNIEYVDANNAYLQLPLSDTYVITPTFSANQTTARDVIVTLLVDSFIDL